MHTAKKPIPYYLREREKKRGVEEEEEGEVERARETERSGIEKQLLTMQAPLPKLLDT